jgi:hypothetical protein
MMQFDNPDIYEFYKNNPVAFLEREFENVRMGDISDNIKFMLDNLHNHNGILYLHSPIPRIGKTTSLVYYLIHYILFNDKSNIHLGDYDHIIKKDILHALEPVISIKYKDRTVFKNDTILNYNNGNFMGIRPDLIVLDDADFFGSNNKVIRLLESISYCAQHYTKVIISSSDDELTDLVVEVFKNNVTFIG